MYSEIEANKRKTLLLIAFFIAFIAGMAYLVGLYYGDYTITIGALVGAIIYAVFSYFASAKTALAFNGAKEIQKQDNPRLWRIVENLAITEGLPMPKVHIIDDAALNAFATGRDPNHAHVAATTGIIDALDDSELQGVMAHELGHIKNYDIRVSMIVFGLVMIISILSDVFLRMSFFGGRRDSDEDNGSAGSILAVAAVVAIVISPIVAAFVQSAVSRKREYLADATGALTTRYPEGLASALEKLQSSGTAMRRQNTSTAHLFFASPLKGKSFMAMFSTHPPIEERIARLRSMGTKV